MTEPTQTSPQTPTQATPARPTTPYGTLPPASPLPQRRPISLPRLAQMREAGEKITMLTAYDATFAAVADAAGVECILVGDSLGMVCQGLPSTVGVSLDTMAYHTASVARGRGSSLTVSSSGGSAVWTFARGASSWGLSLTRGRGWRRGRGLPGLAGGEGQGRQQDEGGGAHGPLVGSRAARAYSR